MKTIGRFLLALAVLSAVPPAHANWGPWPDTRFLPEPSGGESFEELQRRWTPVDTSVTDESGVYLVVNDESPRRFRIGDRVGVFFRNLDGSLQGLAGRGIVETIDRRTRDARVRVQLAHLTEYYLHGPWTGWTRKSNWRRGYAPGPMKYFVSHQNLTHLPEETWQAILSGAPYRGMPARDLLRTWGSPAARGAMDYAHGRQEQWVWQLGPRRRAYAYVDVATRQVTGFHTE